VPTSRYPTVVDHLVAALRAADLLVWDGPLVTGDTRDAVFVGYDADPDSEWLSAELGQSWAGLGARTREETFAVRCAVLATTGETEAKPARDAAFALLAVVETVLRAGPSLGLTPTPMVAEVVPTAIYTEPGEATGVQVRIPFEIRVKTRV
jgi:hypothetical protein